MGHIKYGHGHQVADNWVVGMVCRETRDIFYLRVNDRTK
jgi:hypothetical protein